MRSAEHGDEQEQKGSNPDQGEESARRNDCRPHAHNSISLGNTGLSSRQPVLPPQAGTPASPISAKSLTETPSRFPAISTPFHAGCFENLRGLAIGCKISNTRREGFGAGRRPAPDLSRSHASNVVFAGFEVAQFASRDGLIRVKTGHRGALERQQSRTISDEYRLLSPRRRPRLRSLPP